MAKTYKVPEEYLEEVNEHTVWGSEEFVEVHKKSDVEKEIETFEKKIKPVFLCLPEEKKRYCFNLTDWHDFKTKLLKGEG
jgi:hypothetical protein